MKEQTFGTDLVEIGKKKCNSIMLCGFLLRILLLIFMLTLGMAFADPYFIEDDIKYEETVQYYMTHAKSSFDMQMLGVVEDQYIAPLWPWIISVLGYMFKTIYAGRVLNILMSTLCIKLIYELTYRLSENTKTALFAAKLFAFLPVTIMTCCFPIKDILLTLAVLYVFYFFVCLQRNEKLGFWEILACVLAMVGCYYSRGGVMELLLIFFFVFYVKKFVQKKNYLAVILAAGFALIVLYLFRDTILTAFETKIDDYGGEDIGEAAGNGIAFAKINGITDIYKLPFTYFFAMLQPMALNLFTAGSTNIWNRVLAHLNISIYPIAIAAFMYVFEKKHNLMFWLLSFLMYAAVITLSLGVFRHYLFLLPLQLINCALYFDRNRLSDKRILVTLGSFGLFLLVLMVYNILWM